MEEKFDHSEWVKRAERFCKELIKAHPSFVGAEINTEPVWSNERVEGLQQSLLPVHLPLEYQRFLQDGAGKLDFLYHLRFSEDSEQGEKLAEIFDGSCDLNAGAVICNGERLLHDLANCKEWANDTWIAESPDDFSLWSNGLPFASLVNGDYLAMDLTNAVDDPQVLYLSHDDRSFVISPSFTNFLNVWEMLGYIGPENWVLEPFLDAQTGWLAAHTDESRTLREIIGVPS